jgi:hypothetical protein
LRRIVSYDAPTGATSELNGAAADLLDRLIPQAIRSECAQARRLVVLPDGPLNALPLEMLLTAAESETPPKDMRQEIA